MTNDKLTLSIRIHDPKEKDSAKSTNWVVALVSREHVGTLTLKQFIDLYMLPAAGQLTILKLKDDKAA